MEDLGICQVCGVEPGKHVMYPAYATDEDRANGPSRGPIIMCEGCAVEAFESGEYESDEN
jgi:hypothetical protein